MSAPATREQVERWREMAERFHAALKALRHPPYSDAASEEYLEACAELHFASPTAIPAMAALIEAQAGEIERLRARVDQLEAAYELTTRGGPI